MVEWIACQPQFVAFITPQHHNTGTECCVILDLPVYSIQNACQPQFVAFITPQHWHRVLCCSPSYYSIHIISNLHCVCTHVHLTLAQYTVEPDTNGTEKSGVVSLFKRLKCMQEWCTWGGKGFLLKRCPQPYGSTVSLFYLPRSFAVCTHATHTMTLDQ